MTADLRNVSCRAVQCIDFIDSFAVVLGKIWNFNFPNTLLSWDFVVRSKVNMYIDCI